MKHTKIDPSSPSRSRQSGFTTAAIVALLVLLGSAGTLGAIITTLKLQLKKLPIEPGSGLKFHTLPEEFPGWKMVSDDVMSADAVAELGTENYVSRWYAQRTAGARKDDSVGLQLHCAYYTGMIDTVPHVPERCMIGGGMEYAGDSKIVKVPIDISRLTPDPDHTPDARGKLWMGRNDRVPSRIRLPYGIENLQMRVTPFRDAGDRTTVYAGYFFIANGGVVPNADDVRLLAFKLEDDYAYYAKIQFMSSTVESAEDLARLAGGMLDEIFPDIMMRVPDWALVEEGIYPRDNPRRKKSDRGGEPESK